MISRTHIFSTRLLSLALGLFAAALLTGCEGQKIVARVNVEPITEEQFYKRTVRVTPNELPQGANFDAGGVTMISMVVEKITEQYAKEKNLTPKPEEVNRTVEYFLKSNPLLRAALNSGRFDQDDVARRVRSLMLDLAIGTNGASADQAKLEELYKQRVANMTVPESYVVQLLPVSDETVGNRVLEELKKTGDFQTAARMAGIPPQVAMNAGQETPLPVKNLDEATKAELEKVAPGKFSDKPIKLTLTNPPQSATVVLKMVGKDKEYVPTLEDVKFILTQELLTQAQPQWQAFKNQQLAEATRKADIQINIKRYQYLTDVIRAQADTNAQGAPPGTAPPTGSGTQAPPSGTPPPTGSGAPSGGSGNTTPPSSAGGN